jgi:nucleoside-diphosphate-sugar epimerase
VQTAFVTGGTGFVGINLVSELTGQGWAVTCLHRRNSNLEYLRRFPVQLAVGDLNDAGSLRTAIPQDVDAVFHVAADTSSWKPLDGPQTQTNVIGTRNLVGAALERRAKRFVLTSTAAAYGRQKGAITEETPSTAETSWINYERSKWLSEQEVHVGVARGLHAVIINPCAIFGPFDTSVWGSVFRTIRDGKMKVMPPGAFPINHSQEVARVHIAAASHGRLGENYILGGENVPIAHVFLEMAKLLGVKLRASVVPEFLFVGMARLVAAIAKWKGKEPDITPEIAQIMCGTNPVTNAKAVRDLGYRPRPLEDCLRDSYQWLTKEGLL